MCLHKLHTRNRIDRDNCAPLNSFRTDRHGALHYSVLPNWEKKVKHVNQAEEDTRQQKMLLEKANGLHEPTTLYGALRVISMGTCSDRQRPAATCQAVAGSCLLCGPMKISGVFANLHWSSFTPCTMHHAAAFCPGSTCTLDHEATYRYSVL